MGEEAEELVLPLGGELYVDEGVVFGLVEGWPGVGGRNSHSSCGGAKVSRISDGLPISLFVYIPDVLYRFLTEGALPEGPAMLNHLVRCMREWPKAAGKLKGIDKEICSVAFVFNNTYIGIGKVQWKERIKTDESVKYLPNAINYHSNDRTKADEADSNVSCLSVQLQMILRGSERLCGKGGDCWLDQNKQW
jgi:hypothetical protein